MGAPRQFRALPIPARRFVGAVCGAALVTVVLALAQPAASREWSGVPLFAVLVAFGHLIHAPSREQTYVLSGPFVLAAALALPPTQAMVAIALGLLPGEINTPAAWYTKVFNYALYLGGAALASLVFHALARQHGLLAARAVPAALTALAVFTGTNLLALGAAVALTHRRSLAAALPKSAALANVAIDGTGLGIAALWQVDPWLLVYGLIPLAAGAYALWMPQLEEELRLDAKTGLYNARHATDTLHRLVPEHRERRRPLTVLMIDMDNLRELNNRYGHLMGDRALERCAQVLRDEVRAGDLVARFGGEEFVVVMPDTTEDDAALVAERVRHRVRVMRVRHDAAREEATITVSIGVAALAHGEDSAAALLHRADVALYEAKRTGRDRVVVAPRPKTRSLPRMPRAEQVQV